MVNSFCPKGRGRQWRWVGAMAIVGLSLGGCGEARVRLNYVPASGGPPVAGAASVPITVKGVDARAQNADRVSTKRDPMKSPVRAENDVVDLVRRAVETELKAKGFPARPGTVEIVVELEEFYSEYELVMYKGEAQAKVAFTLKVKGASGVTRFSRSYSGTGVNAYFSPSGENAKLALERALAAALQEVMGDGKLSQAILSAGVTSGR
jgi:uncharacterized lipoprotein YajG